MAAVDTRFYARSPSSPYEPEPRPLPHSTASTPSLRSRNSVYLPMAKTFDVTPGGGNVKVVVRVRSFLPREINKGAECIVEMDPRNQETRLLIPGSNDNGATKPNSRKVFEEKSFTFDNSFWSHVPEDPHYAHQEDVYNSLGEEFLDHNFEGYNTCIFAYGQTGSGKSYTMMGTSDAPGLIPRTCEDLFERIESSQSPNTSYNVRVSYFEVYNEHVRDLLVPRTDPPHYLKIRESPTEGPYVKDLSDHPVRNYSDIMRLMRMGDTSRTTAATKMNDTSSRSHAVFTIVLKQIHADMASDETTERTARIRLVDLAGSERAKATEATGARLREGSNINKSLTTLGRVIAALAEAGNRSTPTGTPTRRTAKRHTQDIVPYRDSILTWLLKDSLGGNSKTAMIACISPSDYDETLSTLRYADQAKKIKTRAVVNQDCLSTAERDAQIVEMQETIRQLQLQVSQSQQQAQQVASQVVRHSREKEESAREGQLEEYQKQVDKMQRLMEETRLVSECKIRALATENEALRLHLKLAVDSIKNPVKIPSPKPAIQLDSKSKALSRAASRGLSLGADALGEELEKENQLPDVMALPGPQTPVLAAVAPVKTRAVSAVHTVPAPLSESSPNARRISQAMQRAANITTAKIPIAQFTENEPFFRSKSDLPLEQATNLPLNEFSSIASKTVMADDLDEDDDNDVKQQKQEKPESEDTGEVDKPEEPRTPVEMSEERGWDSGSETEVDGYDATASYVQDELVELQSQLSMFRRKLGADQDRFLRQSSIAVG